MVSKLYIFSKKTVVKGLVITFKELSLIFFNNDTLMYARGKATKEVGTQAALTTISYLGEMTKEQALGVRE